MTARYRFTTWSLVLFSSALIYRKYSGDMSALFAERGEVGFFPRILKGSTTKYEKNLPFPVTKTKASIRTNTTADPVVQRTRFDIVAESTDDLYGDRVPPTEYFSNLVECGGNTFLLTRLDHTSDRYGWRTRVRMVSNGGWMAPAAPRP